MEVLAEQAELPELIGDVLADVGHRAVRAHDDLLALIGLVLVCTVVVRSSSALVAASVPSPIGITQQPFSRPSVCRKTAPRALSCSNAVAQNAGAGCRPPRSAGRSPRSAAPSSPGGMRTMRSAMKAPISASALPPSSIAWSASAAHLEARLVGRVPLGHAGVEVPAVVVEPHGRVGDRALARRRGRVPRAP